MDKVEEVAVRLKEEVDLLYFIEKDVSLIKEELNQVMEVKKKFEEREKERKQMREKIRKIRIPFYAAGKSGKAWAEELAWSELGDYVRKLLRGEDSG